MTEPRGSSGARRGAALALIALAAAVPYLNALWGGFTLDDRAQIQINADVHTLSPPWHAFTVDIWGGQAEHYQMGDRHQSGIYRPLYILTCALQWAMHGGAALPFHLVNVLMHLAVCLLVWRLVVRLGGSERTALITALLFAAAPIHTEAVTSIVGRAEMLAALGMMGAVFVWVGPTGAPPSWSRAAGAAAWVAVGMFSKENAIAAPLLVILATVYRPLPPSPSPTRETGGEEGVGVAPSAQLLKLAILFLPILLFLALRWHVFGTPLWRPETDVLDNPLVAESFGVRFLAAPVLLLKYVSLTVLPITLSADYSLATLPVTPPSVASVAAGFGSLLAAIALALLVRPWRRAILFGLVGMGLTLALILNWPLVSTTIFGERLFYTASLFVCLLAGAGLSALWERQRAVALGVTAGVVLLFGARTALRNLDWRTNFTLAHANVLTSPNSARAHAFYAAELIELADVLEEQGYAERASEARKEAGDSLVRALEVYPNYADVRFMQAMIAAAEGDVERAEALLAGVRDVVSPLLVEALEERLRNQR